jgi:serine/threonine protein kinase
MRIYGCVRDGGYFTALCLKKYGCSLQDAVQNGDCTVDPHLVLDGISKGLHFLHNTLNIVHNDINPNNIMLDDDGNAVIIDFDSCMPIGQEIGLFQKAGTFGWTMDPAPVISLPENDTYGLTLISNFLEGKDTDGLTPSTDVSICSVFNAIFDICIPST